jgi:signal transduction histidine kinase
VLRHSKATEVKASLSIKEGQLMLSIADNGIGFNAVENESKKTLGLLGMKERTLIMGGTYEINSKPGNGTTVEISVPIAV